MVSYFLLWTLLKFFNSIPVNHYQQEVGQITCSMINTSNEVKCLLLRKFWNNNISHSVLERAVVGSIVNTCMKNECHFFWVHWGMNLSVEQTNHPRIASQFTWFVCPVLRFIPPWTQKKDTHSLNNTHDAMTTWRWWELCY